MPRGERACVRASLVRRRPPGFVLTGTITLNLGVPSTEIGYLPISRTEAMLFFQLLSRRYEHPPGP